MQQKNVLYVFLGMLAVALASATIGFFLGRTPPTEAGSGAPEPAPVDPRIAQLEAKTAELQAMLQNAPPQVSRVETTNPAEIEAAVAAWLEKHGDAARASNGAPKKDAQSAAHDREQAIADALATLIDPATSDAERQKLWKELGKAGLLDAMVAEFEKRAELDPNDADKKTELGSAYLQKLFSVGSAIESGVWANKADKAFDSALAIDDRHWEARFSKAVSLSFWPPLFGKQKESINNFEVLVAQQASLPADPRYAQTHLWLGNLYQQSGEHEKAVAAWRAGLDLYPDDEALKKQLAQ